ncbi:MAG TPA: extracellular solute-binding protein, partial [Gaiellaceae bacterium]|nr:extracellular solute-binding protein [Gaiellaceae bacterium]
MFACLAAQNGRAVPRDELAELLWGEDLPATWEKALRVLMTKLRALLEECGIDGSTALTSAFGCYKLTLPAGAWIDVDAAVEALERAEAALAGADRDEARSQANVAAALARRTFLPGEDGPWVEEKRRDLRDVLVRALECMRDATFGAGEYAEAVRHAEEVTELEPFRESGYRRLMECHAAAGNTAEALRVYEGCRRFLADELGAYPSPETEAAYLEILRAERASATQDEAQVEDVPPDRRRPVAVALLGAIVVVAAAAAVVAYGRTNGPAVGSADNPITIVTAGLGTDPEQEAFEAMLRTFEQTTGFEAELQKFPVSEPSYVDWIRRRVEEGSAPTLAILGPGNLADFAREGVAKPLASLGLGEDRLRQSYGRAWLDLATVDGELYGFPNGAISKSLLWYRPDDLERLGLRVPRTWAGLVSATRKLERAGETPWALAAGDAWTLTDWFENVYLRTAGPWRYDALFAGKLPFDDPSVLAALRRMTRILRDEYVAGGISGALATSFPDALEHVFGREPRAQLYMEGGFVGPLALE